MQKLIDGANVQAVSISSVTQQSASVIDDPPPPFTEHANPPSSTKEPIKKAGLSVDPSPTAKHDLAPTQLTPEGQLRAQMDSPNYEDMISLAETDMPSTTLAENRAVLGAHAGLHPSPENDDSTLWRPISTPNSSESRRQVDATTAIPAFTSILSETAIWHGQLSQYLYDREYQNLRDRLADAAYFGNWNDVEAIIDDAHERGLRSWPNCYRIGRTPGPSGWTPLHQAAFLGAPESVVRMLVDLGASRTLQTVWTSSSELPFRNMTALEIARFLGFKYLFDALSPVARHVVPCTVLHKVQQNFHHLIRGDSTGRPEMAHLRLPELDLLTELENPEMYFPLKSPKINMVTPSRTSIPIQRVTHSDTGILLSVRRSRTPGHKSWNFVVWTTEVLSNHRARCTGNPRCYLI